VRPSLSPFLLFCASLPFLPPTADKVAPLNAQIEDNQRLLAPWQEQIEAKSNEAKIASQQLADVRGRAAHAQDEIARVEQEMEELGELQKGKIGEMRELRKRQKEVKAALQEVKERLAEQKKLEARAKQAAGSAREKTVEAKASQSASQSKGQVLTAVQKLKDHGRLPGFHVRSPFFPFPPPSLG
jgi:structural maintenance of chromosome 4